MLEELAIKSAKLGMRLNPEKTTLIPNEKKKTVRLGTTELDYNNEYTI